MFRTILLPIFLLFLFLPGMGQNKEILQIEKRISLIKSFYDHGSYSEVISNATKLKKELSDKKYLPSHYYIESRIYLVKANYSILEFNKASELLKSILSEIDTIQHEREKALSFLLLTKYYNETGSYQKASNTHKSCAILNDTADNWIKLEYQTEKFIFLIGQQYLAEAKRVLSNIEETSMNLKNLNGVTNGLYLLTGKKAQIQNLKLQYLLTNGQYNELEKQLPIVKKNISESPGVIHPEYSKCLELEADLCWERQQHAKAARLYKEAYTSLQTSEYQQHKIYLLSRVTTLAIYLNDVSAYDQYMRRIQLHADRNIHKYNYFQLAHGYSEAYFYFVKGDYALALTKTEKIFSKYPSLPPNHFFRKIGYRLKTSIYEEDAQMPFLTNTLDTLYRLSCKYSGEDTPASQRALLALLKVKIKSGENFDETKKIMTERFKETILQSDSNGILVMDFLNTLSDLYFQTDLFDLAKKKSDQVKRMALPLFGPNSWEYILLCMKNIQYSVWAGNYKEAIQSYADLNAMDKQMKATGNSFQYTQFLHFCKTGKILGDFNNTNTNSLLALKLLESEPKNKRLVFSDIREEAAVTYIETSNLYAAEKILLQSLAFKQKKLSVADPALLHVYKELARLYIINGNFTQADKILSEYLKLSKQIYGTKSMVYNEGVFLSGEYFMAIGDHKRAKESFDSCLTNQLARLGNKNIFVALTYLQLAQVDVKIHSEKFINNEKSFKTAGSIIEETIGKENPFYAQYLQLLAEFYISFAKYNQAFEMLTEANQYWESKLGTKNAHSADIAMLFGKIAYLKSLYSDSEIQYTKAKNIYETIYSETHPAYSSATAQLAKVAYMLHDHAKSLSLMEVCIPKYLTYVDKYFPSLSFKEKSKFWFSMKDEFEFYNFLVINSPSDSRKKFIGSIYNNVIATKALLLSSDIKLRKQINASGDTILIRMFEEWLLQKELLTNMVSFSKEVLIQQGLDPRKIELRLESLEKEISIRSEFFQSDKKKIVPNWKDIQSALTDTEYAIEIIRYRYFDKVFKDSVIYAALIVGKEMKDNPELVVLPDGNTMEERGLKYYRNAVIFNIEDDLSYVNYWKPIKSRIPDNALVYLSSDGVYNQINVEIFSNPDTRKFVLDENQLVQLTNTKDILSNDRKNKSKNVVLENGTGEYILCGNPTFYKKTGSVKSLPALPGAENEVRNLGELLNKSGKKIIALLNDQVTEDTLKSFKNPIALHIATHGYFKETKNEDPEDFSSNPLLNSGLMLSGSGDILNDKANPYVNSAGGILTAYEVVNMNLDKTEIVVLSACETGKGQLKAGEGVYGLQRSFLVAGANCVILSLFKVNDEVTKELMIAFYSNWIHNKDKRTSFNEAKKMIKEKYKFPIYWGAFIMMERRPEQKIAD